MRSGVASGLVDEAGEAQVTLPGHFLQVGPELFLELDGGPDLADTHGLADHVPGLPIWFRHMRITPGLRHEV